MKILLVLLPLLILVPYNAYSQTLDIFTDNSVYSDNDPLFVYGKALPNENLIIRLIAPDETIAKFDQITADDAGNFSHMLLTWPGTSN